MIANRNLSLGTIFAVAMFVFLVGCTAPPAPRDLDDGAFEGTVSRVWEDGLMLDVGAGDSVLIDTWGVCGDNTARNISTGDSVRVYATRDLISYDAWRILDATGQPACDVAVVADTEPTDTEPTDTELTVGMAQRNTDDGAFVGTVGRVWSDGMTLEVDGGGSIRIDTWAVCGDHTARNISTGDRVRVYASRDLLSYDAWRILDEDGEPLCGRAVAAADESAPGAPRAQRNADDGAFVGTVGRVWSDGMRLDTDDGGSIRIDTWAVCGDNTARNIRMGDRVRVYASRSLFSYDAWRILDEEGQPACSRR